MEAYIKLAMGFFGKLMFYFALILALVVFLKLDKRFSLVSRILISIAAVIILIFLFFFVSTLIAVVLIVIAAVFLVSFLERRKIFLRKR